MKILLQFLFEKVQKGEDKESVVGSTKKGKQLPHIFQFCYQRFISGYNGHSTHKKIKIRTKYFVLKKGKRTKSLRKLMLNGKGIPPKKTRQIVIKSSFLAFRVELYFIWPTKGR